MQVNTITRVDKSQLANMTFNTEVNAPKIDSSLLKYKLNRALTLGNLYKTSVRIQFTSQNDEFLETEATIWAVTEKYVMLKGGVMLPIDCIIDVIM